MILLRLLFLALCLIHAAFAAADERLRVIEGGNIFWIDNERLLYMGYSPEELEKIAAGKFTYRELYSSPGVLYVWDTRTNRILQHATVSRNAAFCFSEGMILYGMPASITERAILKFGPFGSEKEDREVTAHVEKWGLNSRARCANPDESFLRVPAGRFVHLLESHGYVEFRGSETYLHQHGRDSPVLLKGVTSSESFNLVNRMVHFARWKGAYFNYTPGVFNMQPSKAWWLYPDGRVEWVDIPQGPWSEFARTNAFFTPTRAGLLIRVGYPKVATLFLPGLLDAADARLQEPQVWRSGSVWDIAVAPDGCKVAITFGSSKVPSLGLSKVELLNICTHGKK